MSIRHRAFKRSLLSMILLACSAHLSAQLSVPADELKIDKLLEMDLEDLLNVKVSVASKDEQSVSSAPGIVSVLTRSQIIAYGARNLGDLMEQLPAVYRGNLFTLHDNYVSVRGQAADGLDNRSLITLNGRPLRDYWTGGSNQTVYRGMPIDAIERIEMIRGPGSVLYGSNAFSDVINIVTRDPDTTAETLRLTTGSFNSQSGAFTSSFRDENIKGLTSINYDHVGGWNYSGYDARPAFLGGPQYGQQKNGWDTTSIVSSWTSEHAGLDLFYSDVDADAIGPDLIWPGTITETERGFVNIFYENDISPRWNLRGDFTGNSDDEYTEDGFFVRKQDVHTHNFIYELTARGEYTDFNFIGGVAVSKLYGNDSTSTIFVPEANISGNATWYNGYFQGDYRASDKLNVILGVQVNKPESIEVNLSPRIGVIYQFTSAWGMKALYGKAFRTASWSDSNSNLSGLFVGNSSIAPEEIATTDLQLFYRRSDITAAASVFYSVISNTFTNVSCGAACGTTVTNGGDTSFTGGELEWQWNASPAWSYEGSVALQRNKTDKGNNTRLSPEWLIKQGVSYHYSDRWHWGVFDNYVSAIKNPTAQLNPRSESVHILNINSRYDMSGWFNSSLKQEVELTITNALNSDPVYQPDEAFKVNLPWRAGRAVYLTYRGEF